MIRQGLAGRVVLVTGGAGFIGSHLVDRLLVEGAKQVVVLDNMFIGTEANLAQARAAGDAVLYRDDSEIASSLSYLFERHDIDVVFNCATKALNYSFLNPSNAFSTNVSTVLNLLELQRRGAFQTLCQFSSSEVYGSALYEPMDEEHPKLPLTTYAAGKAAADLALHSYVKMFDVDAFVVRPFNNFGPRQNWQGPMASVISITAARILQGETPQVNGAGRQTRDFIFVDDTVDAVVKLYQVLDRGEAVNISTGNQIEIGTLVRMICEHYGWAGGVRSMPGRTADVLAHNASNAKAHSLIDYRLTPFPEALARTLDWYADVIPAAR